MLFFATYFDKNYLSRGLSLLDSLKVQSVDFQMYILCLDDSTLSYFITNAGQYPNVVLVPLSALETADAKLLQRKSDRSLIEYYFTISPCLPLYLLKQYALPHICTLDADIQFLASPQPLFEYLDHYSVVITPHKFSPPMQFLDKYGQYNVSFQIFKNDEAGIRCLEHWRTQCLDWCEDRFDEANNRYADQKYLDAWPKLFPGRVKELDDDVSGLAPWNLARYQLTLQNDQFYSNGQRLIYYHYHHFKIFSTHWAGNGLRNYAARPDAVIGALYLRYWNRLLFYNQLTDTGRDESIRIDLGDRKRVKLLKERSLYLRLSDRRILEINMDKIPNFVKQLLLKLYA